MPPSDNTNTQGGSKNAKDDEAERKQKLKSDIEEIWKEIKKDVKTLSNSPDDKRNTKWNSSLISSLGKNKRNKQAQGKKDDDPTEKVEDPTKEILEIMGSVTPSLNTENEKFRAAVTNTVQCINTLGNIIAGPVSQVFAPAPSCFNAISFFLQFWLNYVDMLEKLEVLLTKCNDFIDRLHIYNFPNSTDDVDGIELRYIAAKLMGNLVKVLRFSVDIHKSKRFISAKLAKQSFLHDNEIGKLMDEMSSLVEREHHLLATLSYKGITNIKEVMAQEQVAVDSKAWRIAISKALGFADEEPKGLWQNKLEEIRNSLIPNTGKWVTETQEFKDWVALPSSSVTPSDKKSFLAIEGAENSGKSYLMANIVNYLDQMRPAHAIAYYFHDRDADRQMDRTRTLSLVSKCLLWQCATSLGLLLKSMAEKCQHIGYNPNIDDMWGQLFLQNTRIDTVKTQFYILVDGVDDGVKDVIQVLKTLVEKHPETFRILIATRSSDKGGLFPCLALSKAVEDKINEDIDLYIQHHLKNMPAFEESTHPKAAEYKEKIAKRVREKTRGDFAWMTIALEKLRSKHHLLDIDRILLDMEKHRKDQIKGEIEHLNRSLSAEEIKEINEVILWVITSQVTPTLDDMSAVLSFNSHTESLMPLRRRLNPLLQANESDRIKFRLSEIKNEISKKFKTSSSQSSAETRSFLGAPDSLPLVEAEAETVHCFLKYVSPRKDDYDKKALESILWGDLLKGKTTISYDKQNAHLKIALTCLRVLISESNEHTERLIPYVGKYLLYHLGEAKPKEADINLKASLVSRWFSDSTTRSKIPESSKTWVNDLINKNNASRLHEILFRGVAERLATRLFLGKTYTIREQLTAVYFLSGYIARTGNQEDAESYQTDRNLLNWEEFRRISEWATASPEVGNASDKTSWFWKIQTARTIFTVCKYDQDANKNAQELLKEVQSLDGSLWQGSVLACQTITKQLQSGSYLEAQKAQKILRDVTRKLLSSDKGLASSKSDSLLAAIAFLDLGNLYWKENHHGQHQRDRAAKKYQQSLNYDATRYARYVDVLHQYRQAGLHSQIIDLVRDLTPSENFDKVYLKRLVYDFLAKDEFRRSILSATGQKNWEKVVDGIFKKAIKTAQQSHVELFHILKAYGEILHQSGDMKREDAVINHWEEALKHGPPLASTTSDVSWPDMLSIIDPLACIYLHRAEKGLVAAKAENKIDTISIESVKAKLDSASLYLNLIEEFIKELEQKTDMWMNTTLICCKARYYTVAGNPEIAKSAVSKVIAASISILSDDDETNDWFAYLQLWRIMEALQDDQHSKEARKRLESLVTPSAGPTHWFHCNGCEKSIHRSEKMHVCLQSFGLKYFHKNCCDLKSAKLQGEVLGTHRCVIISPGTSDSKAVLESRRSLSDWKAQLQEKYVHLYDVVDVSQLDSFIPPLDAPTPTAATPTFPGDPPTFAGQ
ncbi:hypothetical protein N431DRAFT_563490 [Stipitochalara longipes BDJ]|nr:hypothetical protein N431DRAFT_563490 [Stipitochalara longipes BDJ]